MRKKAQIAAAFITEPPVLILDEPLRGLDKTATVKVVELLQQAVGRGGILLMDSHYSQVSEEIIHRIMTFPLCGTELSSTPYPYLTNVLVTDALHTIFNALVIFH